MKNASASALLAAPLPTLCTKAARHIADPRRHTPWLFIILTSMGLFSGWLRGADYRHDGSGVSFPDKVGALQRGKEQKYEAEPGQGGVAIPYHCEGAEVTVYLRNLPKAVATNADDALMSALNGIKELETQGKYEDVKIYTLDPAKLRPGWKGAAFTSKSDRRFIVSFIYCHVRPGLLFKVRATTGEPRNEKLMADLASLITAIDGGD